MIISPSKATTPLDAYTLGELHRVFREHLGTSWPVPVPADEYSGTVHGIRENTIVIGSPDSNRVIQQLIRDGVLSAPTRPQGYAMRCLADPAARSPHWLLAIAGTDAAGTLFALRDLEHYYLKHFRSDGSRLTAAPFDRADYPRIEYRGHWSWGCNMPDKKAWIENMSRWKLNELIHWDNYLAPKAREYVDFAHERGIRVVWGFGWGWLPEWNFHPLPAGFDHGQGQGVDMCGSSPFNLRFFREGILQKIREDYVPTGCDGVYFQAFTECPKCQCPRCRDKTMGRLMLDFVNPIVADIKREFPDLWISCGIHSDFGDFIHLKDLDPRCNIFWENCDSGTSVRGETEDFGYMYKKIHYGPGYTAECPADPPYTEESLREWMASNAARYVVPGGAEGHYAYMQELQRWGRNMLGKKSIQKHASVVADHAVFCRRTPFPHAALAEAQWNPDLDTIATVDAIMQFLGISRG